MVKNYLQTLGCSLLMIISACSSTENLNQQQLKEITDEINVGMSKTEVEEVLGNPHVHPFSKNLWIYQVKVKKKRYNLALYFTNDKLMRIEKVNQ